MIGSQGASPVAAPSSHPIALILQSSAGRGGVERVLIVDDHPLVRDGLRTVISVAFDQADLFEASSVAEAVEIVDREGDFDLVLLDLNMPDARGFSGLTMLRDRFPDLALVPVFNEGIGPTMRYRTKFPQTRLGGAPLTSDEVIAFRIKK